MFQNLLNPILIDVNQLAQLDLDSLDDFISRHPYATLPRFMKAKWCHEYQQTDFQEALTWAALYAFDRQILFNLIEKKLMAPAEESVRTTVKSEKNIHVETPDLTIMNHEPEKEEPLFDYVPYELEMQQALLDLEKSGLGATLPQIPISNKDHIPGLPEESGEHTFTNWIAMLNPGNEPCLVHRSAANRPIKVLSTQQVKQADQEVMEADFDEWQAKELARKSATLNEEAISETLARILVQQGKLDRAEEIYHKLALKYPEKMTYFAGLIEQLKN